VSAAAKTVEAASSSIETATMFFSTEVPECSPTETSRQWTCMISE
jgi:hypothetical protein